MALEQKNTISKYGSLYCYPCLELRYNISRYVKAYVDLPLRSLVVFLCVASWSVHLRAWPKGSWLPWGPCPVCCLLVLETLVVIGPAFRFTFSPAQWTLLQLNGPVQLQFLVVDKTVD